LFLMRTPANESQMGGGGIGGACRVPAAGRRDRHRQLGIQSTGSPRGPLDVNNTIYVGKECESAGGPAMSRALNFWEIRRGSGGRESFFTDDFLCRQPPPTWHHDCAWLRADHLACSESRGRPGPHLPEGGGLHGV
jgi:hypothetical protein